MNNDFENVYKSAEKLLKYQPKKVEGISYINITPPLMDLENLKCTFNTGAIIQPIRDKAGNIAENVVIEKIIDYAQKQGITDLFIIDEEFVKNAIKHEWEKEHKQMTNYDKITESVESLAEIMDNYRWCPYFSNSTCDSEIECLECIKEWLQKECDE